MRLKFLSVFLLLLLSLIITGCAAMHYGGSENVQWAYTVPELPQGFKLEKFYSEVVNDVESAGQLDVTTRGDINYGASAISKHSLVKEKCSNSSCFLCRLPRLDNSNEREDVLGRKAVWIYSHPNGYLIITRTDVCFGRPEKRQYRDIRSRGVDDGMATADIDAMYHRTWTSYVLINTKEKIMSSFVLNFRHVPVDAKEYRGRSSIYDSYNTRSAVSLNMFALPKSIADSLSRIDFSNSDAWQQYLKTKKYNISDPLGGNSIHSELKNLITSYLGKNALPKEYLEVSFSINDKKVCSYYPSACGSGGRFSINNNYNSVTQFINDFMNKPVKYRIIKVGPDFYGAEFE